MSKVDSIPVRIAKLNQIIDGKTQSVAECKQILSRDGLIDSLLALHNECLRNVENNHKNPAKHVSSFLQKGMSHLRLYFIEQNLEKNAFENT